VGVGAGEGEDAEHHYGDHQRPLASHLVGDRAEIGAEDGPQQGAAEDQAELPWADGELGPHFRRREGQDLDVQTVQHRDQEAQHEHQPLEAGEPGLVDGRADVDGLHATFPSAP
jgi:hypothetical protein